MVFSHSLPWIALNNQSLFQNAIRDQTLTKSWLDADPLLAEIALPSRKMLHSGCPKRYVCWSNFNHLTSSIVIVVINQLSYLGAKNNSRNSTSPKPWKPLTALLTTTVSWAFHIGEKKKGQDERRRTSLVTEIMKHGGAVCSEPCLVYRGYTGPPKRYFCWFMTSITYSIL